ncbi:InlB B-repeat-containing protein [Ferruginibacter lapsinanis]|uniref:sugar-binding protein n=1 Tax=Ferruginibacter lapsinanis TaxID=563172 RepID=UPI001E2AC780|nr:sugar-binding protein [Ferruginibacter lapsinanis]UEG49094.1 InlB B-repeat-containing protein [Ferruginibacter lapsinanis]
MKKNLHFFVSPPLAGEGKSFINNFFSKPYLTIMKMFTVSKNAKIFSRTKKLAIVLLTGLFFNATVMAQTIVETFESADWTTNSAIASINGHGRTVAAYATSAIQTISSWNGAALVSTGTAGATANSSWSWGMGQITIASSPSNQQVHSNLRGIMLKENGGYLITPVIIGGVSTVKFWMSSVGGGASVYVGYRPLTGTLLSVTSVSGTNARFQRTQTNHGYVLFPTTVVGNIGVAGIPANGVSGGSFTRNNAVASQFTFSVSLTGSASTQPGQLIFLDDSESSNFSNSVIDDIVITAYVTGPPVITADQTGITQTSAGNIGQNSADNLMSNFRVNVTTSDATLNSLSFAAGGDFVTGDITNFKLYTNTTTTFPGGSPLSTFTATGIAAGGTVTFSGLTQACAIGARYFFITADIPSGATLTKTVNVPATPTLTFAVSTPTNTITAGGTKTIVAPIPPTIVLDHSTITQTTAGNVARSSTDNLLSNFRVNVATSNATLNSLSFAAGGTFVAGDITNFKLYTAATNTFPGGAALSTVSATGIANGGAVTFSTLNQACAIGDRFFWITADIASGGTVGNTVFVPATPTLTFALGTPTNNITVGGTKTISLGQNYYNTATNVTGSTLASWTTNPTGGAGTAPANFTSGDIFNIRAGTNVNSGTWSISGTGAKIVIANTATLTLTGATSLSGTLENNGTFTHGSQSFTFGTGGVIAGTNVCAFHSLTINTTSPSDVVSLTTSGASINNAQTLTLTQGIFKIGTGNIFYFNGGGATITNTANGNLATTGTNGSDGGKVIFSNTSGNSMNINGTGQLTFYDLIVGGYVTGTGNTSVNQNNTNVLINDSLRYCDNNAQWNTNSPKYSSNATLYINNNGQGYTPGGAGRLQWAATSGFVIGTTVGYPNNVTLVNCGNPSTISQSLPINGVFSIGENGLGGNVTISGGTANAFNCGALIVGTASTFNAPAANMTVRGKVVHRNAGANTFVHNSGTVILNGTGTSVTPDSLSLASGSLYNLTMNATNAFVKLYSPVTVSNNLTLPTSTYSAKLTTDATNILTLTNTANTAIAGGYASAYINGPAIWTLTNTSTGTYTMPLGVNGSGYYPFAFAAGTIASGTPTINAQAFASAPGSADGSTLASTSSTEYWKLITTGSTFAANSFSIGRSTPALGTSNAIGKSTSNAATSYISIGGAVNTLSGQPSINTSASGLTGASTIYLATGTKTVPVITLANNSGGQVAAANLGTGSTDNLIANMQLTVSTVDATLQSLTFTTTGTAASSTDITNFKLYYSATNDFSTKTLVTGATLTHPGLGAGSHTFTGLNQLVPIGTRYLWITATIPGTATNNGTIQVAAINPATALVFASGTPSGSTTQAGLQTIIVLPTVTTVAASSVTTTTATLNGTVNANNGPSATNTFDWGDNTQTPPSYVNNNAAPTTGGTATGGANTNVTLALTGLTPNTLYNFRAESNNGNPGSPIVGSNATFTTFPNAPVIGTPSAATANGFTATWSAPIIPGTATYTYTVEVDNDNAFGSIDATQTAVSGTSYTFSTGLLPLTTYYYRVKVVNAAGSSVYSATSTSITTTFNSGSSCTTGDGNSGTPGLIVDAPANPVIDGAVDGSGVWTKAAANTIGTNVIGTSNNTGTWKAMYTADSLYVLVQVNDATTLFTGGTNIYDNDGVELFIDGNNSKGGVYDGANDFQLRFNPGFPNNISGSSNGSGTGGTAFNSLTGSGANGTVNWKATSITNTSYIVEIAIPWAGINSGGSAITAGKTIGFDVEWNDRDAGTTRQTAKGWFTSNTNAYNNPGLFGYASLSVCAPPVLATAVATNRTATSASLGSTVTSINGGTLTANGGGTVYRTTSGVTTENMLSTVTPTLNTPFSQTRSGLNPQTQYFFKAFATRTNFSTNVTGTSSESSFRTLSNEPTTQVANLSATTVSTSQIDLSWDAATFGTGTSAVGYIILRQSGVTAPSTTGVVDGGTNTGFTSPANTTYIGTTTGTTFSSTGLVSGTQYSYTVIAYGYDGTNTDTRNYLLTGSTNTATAATQATITSSAGANGTISPNGATVKNYGTSQVYTITPNTGYHVNDVLVNGVSVGAVSSYTISNVRGDSSISASFAINTYTITSSAGTGGSISPDGATVKNYGTSQAYTITPNTGYHIADVLVNGNSVGAVSAYTISNVRGDSAISASFAINTYTVTYDGNNNTSGTAPVDAGSPYDYNSTVTVKANTGNLKRTGYTFAGWNTAADGNGTDYAATGSATFSLGLGDVVLYAKWSTCSGYTFTGEIDNDYTKPGNWQCGIVPPASGAVTIANGSGKVRLTSNLDVTGSLDFTNTVDTFIIAPGVRLTASGSGSINFHDNAVLIKSDATGTGSIGQITGTLSGTANVTAERYIRQNTYRGWRLLAVPVTTAGQTIRQSWQEGATTYTADPNPGFGTRITASTANAVANGFDAQTFGNSLLQYTGSSWSGFTGSLLTTKVSRGTAADAWMLYVRGDRGVDTAGVITAPTQTVLRVKGPLYTAPYPTVTIPAGTNGLVGNILPSEIDFTLLNRGGGADNAFYLWDPQLYGSYGLGGYQTFSANTPIPWKPVPGGGSYGTTPSSKIQSGLGFMVHASGSDGTIQLTEACKTSGSNVGGSGFRPVSPTAAIPYLETNLYAAAPNNTFNLADGNIVGFDDSYSNDIDNKDNIKVQGFGDGIGMVRGTTVLSAEQRKLIVSGDVIPYRMTNLKKQAYKLEFTPSGLDNGATAVLEDKYLNTTTPFNLSATSSVVFNADPAVAASFTDRFRIVFSTPTPVTITNLNAQQKNTAMQIDWKVAVESGVKEYAVEHSTDGVNFTQVGVVSASANNGGSATYSLTDANPVAGTNYYRIKTVDLSGVVKYTTVVRVVMGTVKSSIELSSTVITNNQVSLQLNNQDKGRYGIRLISSVGQELMTTNFTHNGGNSTQVVSLPTVVSKGLYQLEITRPNGAKLIERIVVN